MDADYKYNEDEDEEFLSPDEDEDNEDEDNEDEDNYDQQRQDLVNYKRPEKEKRIKPKYPFSYGKDIQNFFYDANFIDQNVNANDGPVSKTLLDNYKTIKTGEDVVGVVNENDIKVVVRKGKGTDLKFANNAKSLEATQEFEKLLKRAAEEHLNTFSGYVDDHVGQAVDPVVSEQIREKAIEKLTENVNDLETQMHKRMSFAKYEADRLKTGRTKSRLEVKRLGEQMNFTEKVLKSTQTELKTSEEKVEQLLTEKTVLKTSEEKLNRIVENQKKAIKNDEIEQNELKKKITTLKKSSGDLNETKDKSQKDITRLEKSLESLNIQLENRKSQKEKTDIEIQKLKTKLKTNEKTTKTTETDTSTLTEKIKQLEKDLNLKEKQHKKNEANIETKMQEALKSKELKFDKKIVELKLVNDLKINRLEKELVEAKDLGEADALKKELADLKTNNNEISKMQKDSEKEYKSLKLKMDKLLKTQETERKKWNEEKARENEKVTLDAEKNAFEKQEWDSQKAREKKEKDLWEEERFDLEDELKMSKNKLSELEYQLEKMRIVSEARDFKISQAEQQGGQLVSVNENIKKEYERLEIFGEKVRLENLRKSEELKKDLAKKNDIIEKSIDAYADLEKELYTTKQQFNQEKTDYANKIGNLQISVNQKEQNITLREAAASSRENSHREFEKANLEKYSLLQSKMDDIDLERNDLQNDVKRLENEYIILQSKYETDRAKNNSKLRRFKAEHGQFLHEYLTPEVKNIETQTIREEKEENLKTLTIEKNEYKQLFDRITDPKEKKIANEYVVLYDKKIDLARIELNLPPENDLEMVQTLDLTRFEKFKHWAKDSLGVLTGIAVVIAGVLTMLIVFTRSGVKKVKKLVKPKPSEEGIIPDIISRVYSGLDFVENNLIISSVALIVVSCVLIGKVKNKKWTLK